MKKLKTQAYRFFGVGKLILFCFGITFSLSQCNFKHGPKLFGFLPLPFSPTKDSAKNFIVENTDALFTNEFGRQASFTIKLSKKPENDVTIGSITSSNPAEGVIVTASSFTFTKDNFDQPQTITVQGVPDGVADGNQQYRVKFGSLKTEDYSYSLL
nr:hypothetical protein [Leptospiraceae bacterium]